jgi:LPS sulfotransferase NodH
MAKTDADTFDPTAFLNQGVVARSAPPPRRGKRAVAEKTLLITGLARSGTSMLAALLQAAGVWLGNYVYEPIHEDAEITQMLRARDFYRLDALIERQNAKTPVWGFKMPDLHQYLQHDELGRFRNPHLLVIFRDPVAVAVRNALSEQVDGTEAIIEAASAMHSLAQFVRASGLPFLFLSYEKAIVFPRAFIDNVLNYCGIAADEAKRAELTRHVEPNRTQYVLTANRAFQGHVEGVLNGKLYGWARHVGSLQPVLLDLLIDGKPAATFHAGEFRGDLLAANLGNGSHAFFHDLAPYRLSDAAIIRVRFNGRIFELANSGKSLGELRALRLG